MRYIMGEEGENVFGRRNYLELVSVFTSAPVLAVTDGRQDLGHVDQGLFLSPDPPEGRLLSLAGRGWRVERIDWRERRVYVSPTEALGKTTWFGSASGLGLLMGRAARTVLVGEEMPAYWSQRTQQSIRELRHKYAFLKADQTTILHQKGEVTWFTFAGAPLNCALVEALAHYGIKAERSDDFAIFFAEHQKPEELESALRAMTSTSVFASLGANEEAQESLKFAACLPPTLVVREVVARRCTEPDLAAVLGETRYLVIMQGPEH